jgi:hypothetical protein
MSDDLNRPPHLRLKVALMMVAVAVAEAGFLVARSVGIATVCVGVVVVAAVMAWTVRDGRRMRAAGHRPDLGQLEQRMRRHLKWGAVLVGLSVVTTALVLTTDRPKDRPLWPIVLGPVVLIISLVWVWVLVRFVLPWERRRQQARGK